MTEPDLNDDAYFASLAAHVERGSPRPVKARYQLDDGVDGWSFIHDRGAPVTPVWGAGTDVAWAVGESLMLASAPGVGKTTIGGQLVYARIGITSEVLGYPVAPGERRVLYLALDRPRQIARAFRRLVRPVDEHVLRERLVFWDRPLPATFEAAPELLVDMADAHDADTVVLDSVKDTVKKISDDESGIAYSRARAHLLAAGVELLELHHDKKAQAGDGGDLDSLDKVYGSRWVTAGAGSVLGLSGHAGDPIVKLRTLKPAVGEIGPLDVIHDHTAGTSAVWHSTDLLGLARQAIDGITAKDAARNLFGTEKPRHADVERARRKLEQLATAGHLHVKPGDAGGRAGGTPTTYYAVIHVQETA